MKSRALLKLVLTLTLVFGVSAPLGEVFEIMPTALADLATPITHESATSEDRVPVTDRIPWLIYVVLTSSTVALAWILFSLARARKRTGPRNDERLS